MKNKNYAWQFQIYPLWRLNVFMYLEAHMRPIFLCYYPICINWAVIWDFHQCGMCDQQSLRSACAYAQSDQSLCWSLEYSMSVKLLTEHHLEFLSLNGGSEGSSESTLVKMLHCWKSHVTAHMYMNFANSVHTGAVRIYAFKILFLNGCWYFSIC